jgi:hypothetical protein
MKFEGDLPFNPLRGRLLLSKPTLSIRVSSDNDWSPPMDLLCTNYGANNTGAGVDHVSVGGLTVLGVKGQGGGRHFEFGAFIEKGKGALQGIMSVSLVPKHVLISKLSYSIQLRQLLRKHVNHDPPENSTSNLKNSQSAKKQGVFSSIITLHPGMFRIS